MSLESVIADLAVAINANTAALLKTQATSYIIDPSAAQPDLSKVANALQVNTAENTAAPELKKGKKEKVVTPPSQETVEKAAAAPVVEKVTPPATTEPEVTVPMIRDAAVSFIDANGMDNAPILALAAEYGVKGVSQVPADKRAEVLAKINALKAALKASEGV